VRLAYNSAKHTLLARWVDSGISLCFRLLPSKALFGYDASRYLYHNAALWLVSLADKPNPRDCTSRHYDATEGLAYVLGYYFVWHCILGIGHASFPDASAVYADAFVAVTSLAAQFLMARKKLESWIFWVIVDIVAIAVYLYKDLVLTAGLYGLFLCMALAGYVQWRSSAKYFSPATMAGAD
jgi:nicotinamide riboside transporter PnuC